MCIYIYIFPDFRRVQEGDDCLWPWCGGQCSHDSPCHRALIPTTWINLKASSSGWDSERGTRRVAKTYNSDTSFWGDPLVIPQWSQFCVLACGTNVPAASGKTSRTRSGSAHLGAAGSAGIAGHGAGAATTGCASITTRPGDGGKTTRITENHDISMTFPDIELEEPERKRMILLWI